MNSTKKVAATPNAFNRKSSATIAGAPTPDTALGPLQALATGNTWVGETGYNLMVVPSPLGQNDSGFIVMISQLFETHIFDAVPAPVPNRSRSNGTEQIGAVKYSQTVAENISKNILHEETGMWLNQTVGTAPDSGNGLGHVTGDLTDLVTNHPVIRSGSVPHGNTFQAAGTSKKYDSPEQQNVLPYIDIDHFQNANGELSFLPTYSDGTSDDALIKAYETEILAALERIECRSKDLINFINPICFLNDFAKNMASLVAMPVTTENDLGGVINIPFETAVAGPQSFSTTFLIETINDPNPNSDTTDEQPQFQQLQYLTSIPLLLPTGFAGKPVIFPHWNLNTLLAI